MIRSMIFDASTAFISGSFTALAMHQPWDLSGIVIKVSLVATGVFLSDRFSKFTGAEPAAIGSGLSAGFLSRLYPTQSVEVVCIGLLSSALPRFFLKPQTSTLPS